MQEFESDFGHKAKLGLLEHRTAVSFPLLRPEDSKLSGVANQKRLSSAGLDRGSRLAFGGLQPSCQTHVLSSEPISRLVHMQTAYLDLASMTQIAIA